MKKSYKSILSTLVIGAAITGYALSANAATEGTLGTSSTGTVEVYIDVEGLVQVTSLNDIDMGSATMTDNVFDDQSGTDSFCVFSNTSGGDYNVTVTGANTFGLSDGTDTIPVEYTYNGGGVAASGDTLEYEIGNSSSVTCEGSTNATLEAAVLGSDLAAAKPGYYSEVITLLVEPVYSN